MMTSNRTPRLSFFVLCGVVAVLTAPMIPARLAAQGSPSPERLLQEARYKTQADLDLEAAARLYEQVVNHRGASRSVKATALLELARCYERMGQRMGAQAERVYQTIVRDFGDQSVASQAKARLAALRPAPGAPTLNLTHVERAPNAPAILATDGRRALFWDSPAQRVLYIGDFSGNGERREVLKTSEGPRVYPSRDLSMILLAYPVASRPAGPAKYAVMRTDGSGYREIVPTLNGRPLEPSPIGPSCAAWSRDMRFVVMCLSSPEGIRLLKVAVATGQTEVLPVAPIANTLLTRVEFSPNDELLAYGAERLMAPTPVYVLSLKTGQRHLAAQEAYLSDWTRDGRHLIVSEPGETDQRLILVPIRSDGTAGTERITLSVPGNRARSMADGTLLVSTPARVGARSRLAIAGGSDQELEFKDIDLRGTLTGTSFPSWSADSNRFVYVVGTPAQSTRTVRIFELGGQPREVAVGEQLHGCAWPAGGEHVLCVRSVGGTKTEVLSLSLRTETWGRIESIKTLDAMLTIDHLSADGRRLILYCAATNDWWDWEIGTDRYTKHRIYRSEDGRWYLDGLTPASGTAPNVRIRSVDDGEEGWRPLLTRRLPAPTGAGVLPFRFTRDGNWVVYHDRDEQGVSGLYQAPTQGGGGPRRLGAYPTDALSSILSISPDVRKFFVSFQVPEGPPQYWIVGNYLPPAAATIPSARSGAAR